MGKISEAMKSPRTGQGPNVQMSAPGQLIQGLNPNGNGPCGPSAPTQPMSWGAGCPDGSCSADQLASNLNRAFAGERYPCRELTYWNRLIVDANGEATFNDNSKVTICPTRVIILAPGVVTPIIFLSEFEIGNQNQIVGDPIPFPILDVASYQAIPFVTDCIKAGMPFEVKLTGTAAEDTVVFFGIIGPAIG